ncbi:MAG TPA: transposase family protein [Actinomycetes bacterium]|jgi:hypothetical protein|nr:transposase family protein [Actinomycetes bacterium]
MLPGFCLRQAQRDGSAAELEGPPGWGWVGRVCRSWPGWGCRRGGRCCGSGLPGAPAASGRRRPAGGQGWPWLRPWPWPRWRGWPGRFLRASHPAVTSDACRSGDRHRALARDHVAGTNRPSCQRVHSPHGPSCRTPASPSSPILAAAQRPDPSAALAPEHYRDLLDCLAQITDPRHRRGRRHALTVVLAVAVVAVLTGARSLAAIGEWASDAPGTPRRRSASPAGSGHLPATGGAP